MANTKKTVLCAYCGATFTLKWDDDELNAPAYCCFCGESVEELEELEDDFEGDAEDYEEDED